MLPYMVSTTYYYHLCYDDLFMNAQIACLSICVCFFESLARLFWALVASFNSFLRCADNDGVTFRNFTPFSLCVPVPAVKLCTFNFQ